MADIPLVASEMFVLAAIGRDQPGHRFDKQTMVRVPSNAASGARRDSLARFSG
jgi:hypothetical protein